ncbi:hypothetical protein TNCV_504121 [Trichonephila clavipes]|nr:hypothetical protein TNCV_504121 [Trichonephila clavipes]
MPDSSFISTPIGHEDNMDEAGLTLNKEKYKFGCDKLKYFGLAIRKDGITTDETKVLAIVEMRLPKNSKEVSKFLRMSQWLGIRHVKTVVYTPQANRTEHVNHDLEQMIANYVNDQHDTLDQFLSEFARDETMMPSTSGYNLRPRVGAKVKSRPANEKKTHQGGPVRSKIDIQEFSFS